MNIDEVSPSLGRVPHFPFHSQTKKTETTTTETHTTLFLSSSVLPLVRDFSQTPWYLPFHFPFFLPINPFPFLTPLHSSSLSKTLVIFATLQPLSLALFVLFRSLFSMMSFAMDSVSVLNPKLATTHVSVPFNKLPHCLKFDPLLKTRAFRVSLAVPQNGVGAGFLTLKRRNSRDPLTVVFTAPREESVRRKGNELY